MIGGLVREAAKQPIIHMREVSACEDQELGRGEGG